MTPAHGILIVDKPEGLTSAAVVREVKRLARSKTGHLGTLDPFASGVLPLCLGEGTKIAQFLNTADKTYEGIIRLGIQTDTGDRTGSLVRQGPIPEVSAELCLRAAESFSGERLQTPPMYAAIKQGGVPLYKLARRGVEVDRAPRHIRIDRLVLRPADDLRLGFTVACSKGTYIRVLAEEIGAALGTVAHLEQLRRTRFGSFTVESAVPWPVSCESLAAGLVSPRSALREIAELSVDAATAAKVRLGQASALRCLTRPTGELRTAKLIDPHGNLLAVITSDGLTSWRFARVMAQEQE